MLFIFRGLGDVAAALDRLASIKEPISAAAYEMELNVNGQGMAVLKYLATRRPEYRDWALNDESDFDSYHATYVRLVPEGKQRSLGRKLGEMHGEFRRVGLMLMSNADQQEEFYRTIAVLTEEIDYIIDARLQPMLFAQRHARPDGFGAAVTTADLEAETAEVAQWVANYHRLPSARARDAIIAKLRGIERTLTNLLGFSLPREEAQQARHLSVLAGRLSAAIRQVLALEDATQAARQQLIDQRAAMDSLLDDQIQVAALRGLAEPRREAEATVEKVRQAALYLMPAYVLAGGITGLALVFLIRSALAKLNRGAKAVAAGDLSQRIEPATNDEFGDLALEYNRMVEQLQATTVSRDRLEAAERKLRGTVEDLRREIVVRQQAEQEREALQAELRLSETMSAMGALVAGVAHEVRNPLFGISSTLDAMSARLGTAGYERYLAVLRSEVGRLQKLMSELLSYGKPASREMTMLPLRAAVHGAVEACGVLARETHIAIENRVQDETRLVKQDCDRMSQAFQNLIDNSLKHAPAGTAVVIDARETEPGWISCSVIDRGPGFDSADLPRVFDPFFTRRSGGTGLGLALVQRIVHEHGGRVEAANGADGGAVLTVRLPLARLSTPNAEAS